MSARRLLREKFVLGLFDHPFVDEEAAEAIVGTADFRAAGEAAQRASFTVLTNGSDGRGAPTLPLARGPRSTSRASTPRSPASTATVVDSPAEADVAILRLQAPFEQRDTSSRTSSTPAPSSSRREVATTSREVAGTVPTVIDVFLDRPAILDAARRRRRRGRRRTSARRRALLDVLDRRRAEPQGRLPFDLPRRWPRSWRPAPTCRSTPPTRCSGSGTAWATGLTATDAG